MAKHTVDPRWYTKNFTLDMVNEPWTQVEMTRREVAFVHDALVLEGQERILDIGCGFGRHSIELARQGFRVVGVDISNSLIEYAREQARTAGLDIEFIHADIRQLSFENEFDAVLNLCDGVIGYLETDQENHKLFEVVARALKVGGKSIIHIPSADHARKHFPSKTWSKNKQMIELLEYEWDEDSRSALITSYNLSFGEVLHGLMPIRSRQRLYTMDELGAVLEPLQMRVLRVWDMYGDVGQKSLPPDIWEYLAIVSIKDDALPSCAS